MSKKPPLPRNLCRLWEMLPEATLAALRNRYGVDPKRPPEWEDSEQVDRIMREPPKPQ